MAKLIIETQEFSLPDGTGLGRVCAQAGLVFSCHTGVCGSCLVRVAEGGENLSPLTPEELDLGLDVDRRLACQCRIEKGTVRIFFV